MLQRVTAPYPVQLDAANGHQHPVLPPPLPAATVTPQLAQWISDKCEEMSSGCQSIQANCQACVGLGTSGG